MQIFLSCIDKAIAETLNDTIMVNVSGLAGRMRISEIQRRFSCMLPWQ